MPRKVQSPEAAIALAQEFGIKGQLTLRLDETIVPVRVVSSIARTGALEGYFWTSARHAHGVGPPAPSALYSTVDPYARLEFFDTPAAQEPSSATHSCWLTGISVSIGTPISNWDFARVGVRLPAKAPEGNANIVLDAFFANAFPTNMQSWGIGDGAGAAPEPLFLNTLPMYVPPPISDYSTFGDGNILISTLGEDQDIGFGLQFWTGPKGTEPPGR